jgi:hypothetical protein
MVLSLAFEDLKEGEIEQLEDLHSLECQDHDSHSGHVKKTYHVTSELR